MNFIRTILTISAITSTFAASIFTYILVTDSIVWHKDSTIVASGLSSASLGLFIICGLCLLGLAITYLKNED